MTHAIITGVGQPALTYDDFILNKIEVRQETGGIEVADDELHPMLFPHQRDAVRWAMQQGRALLALSFGLGKTLIQCQIARIAVARNDGKFLVVCPLNVKHQFQEEDGPMLGMDWQYVRTDAELEAATSPFVITNYERVRDGGIDPRKHNLCGASLDEGAVLRSLGSKTYQVFQVLFADVPLRFIATATPSPNEFKEIIYYSQWLGVMDSGQALTRWFKRDSTKAGHLTLHPHHEEAFWLWVSSWALFLYRPSDLSYTDHGYALPKLNVHWHRLGVDHSLAFDNKDNRGQHRLLLDSTANIKDSTATKRSTLHQRLAKALEIIGEHPDRRWLLWHHLEDERRAIEKALPGVVTVYGSQDLEEREQCILDFVHGRIQHLAPKPEIAGSGCNFQRHCYSAIYLGVTPKFHDFIQSVHRLYRFQQMHDVDIHIIYAESEDAIAQILRDKWQQHDELSAKMQEIVRKHGLSHAALRGELKRKVGVRRVEIKGNRFVAVNNDCVAEMKNIPSNSVGLGHTSTPFGDLYEYSIQREDFGHNQPDGFFQQMDYLIPEMYRVLMPGRLWVMHVKDRIRYGHQTASGFMEVEPFSDDMVAAMRKHGFLYEGRRTVVTDVVRENASTYRLGLSEMYRDASKMGCGLPEYLLLFRKAPSDSTTARADVPVVKDKDGYSRARWQLDAHSFWRSNGNVLVAKDLYDYEAHVAALEQIDAAGGLPSGFFLEPPTSHSEWVWDDVIYMRTLNTQQSQKRRESHVCPLPLDIVERTIRLYSNEGDLVLDPFAGLFTVPYTAIKLGRRGYGIELNSEYFAAGVKYCQEAEIQASAPTLFDMLDMAAD